MRQIDRDFIKIRVWAIIVIRLVAVYIAINYGLMQLGNYLVMLLFGWNSYEPNFGSSGGMAVIAGLVAIALWRGAPYLAKKVLPDFTGVCPKCRYSLDNFRAERCPECGLFLGEDFHAPPVPSKASKDDTDTPNEPIA